MACRHNRKQRSSLKWWGRSAAFWAAIFSALLLVPGAGARAADRLSVFVSIVPQKYFVEKIGGPQVTVTVMVKPGASPATYEPRPRQMVQLSRTALYFAIGVPFESVWLKKIAAANPAMQVVHTEAGIKKLPMGAAPHTGAGHRRTGITDPHIWLSPPLVKIQARHIADALRALDPEHESIYEANYQRFANELDALHAELKQCFAARQGGSFMVFHPSWGYFAQTYGLQQVAVEIEGKNPKPARLKELIQTAATHRVRTIFVQPQFSTRTARLIANAIGAKVVVADPLAADWANNLRAVAARIAAAME